MNEPLTSGGASSKSSRHTGIPPEIHTSIPIQEMLERTQDSVRFHMPGHKGHLSPYDTTELHRTDDLYAPTSGIREAEQLAALSCGAAQTVMLTGGATAGLHAMILCCVPAGGTLILDRCSHHAAISACVWGDIITVFTDDLEDALRRHPEANAVLITRPDYYGNCVELGAIAALSHAQGTLVLVDEAHGAHFPWWDMPRSAGQLGADAWVQSAHKTLPALTGAAWLHLGPSVDAGRARRFLRMVQTSSPPFPILKSLDEARAWMDAHGRQALINVKTLLADFRTRLETLGGYTNIHSDDPTRLVIGTRGRGLTGLEAQGMLEAQHIDIEMADDDCLVLICTVADRRRSFVSLFNALKFIPRIDPLPSVSYDLPPPGERLLTLREAVLAPQDPVPLEKAAGRTASISAGLYPPGIPLLLPGETVTQACVDLLQRTDPARCFGVEDGHLICVK